MKNCVVFLGMLLLPFFANANWYSWETKTGQTIQEVKRYAEEMRSRGFYPANIQGTTINGEVRYCSVWAMEEGKREWSISFNQTQAEFLADFDVKKNHYQPVEMSMYESGGVTRFTTVWHKVNQGGWFLYFGMNQSGLATRNSELVGKGFGMADVNAYVENGEVKYAAIWVATSAKRSFAVGLTAAQYQAEFDRLAPQGYVPIDLDVVNFAGQQSYSVIWLFDKTQTWEARHHYDDNGFKDFLDEYSAKGYSLLDVNSYMYNGRSHYAFLFKRLLGNKSPKFEPVVGPTPDPNKVVAAIAKGLLPIAPVAQQTNVWCWLAVGEMVCKHLGLANANPAGNYQCGIIGTISPLGSPCRSNCMDYSCIRASGSNYATIKMMRDYAWLMGQRALDYKEGFELPYATIRDCIDRKQPILCGISYTRRSYYDGAEHAVLIVGYEQTQDNVYVIINDPFTYPPHSNPYLLEGGVRLKDYQYRISLKDFTEGIFWHWSVYQFKLG